MPTGRVYLDYASATPWHPAASAAYARVAAELPADPSRHHRAGRAARDLLEHARGTLARQLGAASERVTFTSGGTEAVHLAVRGCVAANRMRPARVISAAVEHSAVLAASDASGVEHVRVPVDSQGQVHLEALARELRSGACVVNVQHANHEVGTLQPVAEVARLCREHDALLHVDACQTVGRLPVDCARLGADLLSLSAAKFGGGRGTGALVWGPRARLRAILTGDEREGRRRAGLEHLPGIAAMVEALLQLRPDDPTGPAALAAGRQDALRRRLRAGLASSTGDVELHGHPEQACPHIVAASALYVDGETLLAELDRSGFEVHSGSSCATTSGEPSHVLVAMGALTHGHVRASLGDGCGEDEVDRFVAAFADRVDALRRRLLR